MLELQNKIKRVSSMEIITYQLGWNHDLFEPSLAIEASATAFLLEKYEYKYKHNTRQHKRALSVSERVSESYCFGKHYESNCQECVVF